MLQTVRTLMFSKGYRATAERQHATTIQFTQITLGDEFASMLEFMDRMRPKRHRTVLEPGAKTARILVEGLLKVRATKVGKDTFLPQVIKMVEECQESKVPVQEFADKVTRYFVPAVLIVVALTFVLWLIFPGTLRLVGIWAGYFLPCVRAIKLPRATLRKIKQNLYWAFAYNTASIPVAVLGLLHPVIAEAAMSFSSVSVVTNVNRLRKVNIHPDYLKQ